MPRLVSQPPTISTAIASHGELGLYLCPSLLTALGTRQGVLPVAIGMALHELP